MLATHANQIKELYKKYSLKGYIKIYETNSKDLDYSTLTKTYSFDETKTKDVIITFIKNGKKLNYHLDKLNFDELDKVFQKASSIIQFTDSSEDLFLPKIKDNFEDYKLTIDNLSDLGIDFFEKQILPINTYKFKKNIGIDSFSYGVSEKTNIFINSDAITKIYTKTLSGFSLELAYLGNDGENDTDYCSKISTELINLDSNDIRKIENKLIDRSNYKKVKSEEKIMTIAIENSVVGDLVSVLLSMLSAESIIERQSPYSLDDLGKSILSEDITIYNKPMMKDGISYMPFDHEGLSQTNTKIISDGVLENIFMTSKNASKLSLKHNSNSCPTNIKLKSSTVENRLKNANFEFTDIMGLHTIDMLTGNFSLVGDGYIINDENRGDFIRNVHISGNIKDLFNSISSVSDDYDLDGSIYTPTIVFSDQRICF